MGATLALAAGKPHLVYLLADDMGAGDVRALRPECKFPTPHLDQLVREGMAFTEAYTGSAICSPTRYGILTGRYCWREGIGLASGYTQPYLEPALTTVAEFLHGQGYRTHMVGKWHLGGQWTGTDGSPVLERKPKPGVVDYAKGITGGPLDHGFESWLGIVASLDMPPYVYLRDRTPVALPTRLVPAKGAFGNREGLADPNLRPEDVLGDMTREAVRLIAAHDTSEPLFLYLALTAPHSPVVPSAAWQGRSGIDEHADFRMEVDHSVGQVLQAITDKGIADDTLVIFTADNGSAPFAVKSMRLKGHDSSDGRRGWKATWFEGGHRVPFIVRWPRGLTGPGRRDAGMITLEDFFATVADVLGQSLPPEVVDSVSFLPQLQGRPQDKSRRELIMSSLSNKLVLRHQEWVLICLSEQELINRLTREEEGNAPAAAPRQAAWSDEVALYNLKQDVAEVTNVARQNPAVVAKIARLALGAFKTGRTSAGPARPDSSREPQLELLTRLSTLP